ncbi:MAG: hypothetical protein JXA52_02300 [Planctomycetes bacterium]|nr:hypothetical protein [Planctomycetota bacterium]
MDGQGIVYEGEVNELLGMAMGGLGTSTLEIDRAGRFQNVRVQNMWIGKLWPTQLSRFLSVHTSAKGKSVGKVLQLEHGSELPCVAGLQYEGNFPFTRIAYQDKELLCDLSLEAFSPFVPHDADASSLPLVFFNMKLKNPGKETVTAAVALSWNNDIAAQPFYNGLPPQGNQNSLLGGKLTGVKMGTLYESNKESEYLLACIPSEGVEYEAVADWWKGKPGRWLGPNFSSGEEEVIKRWEEYLQEGKLPSERNVVDELGQFSYHIPVGAVSGKVELAPGEEKTVRFALAWYFPHQQDKTGHYIGHQYAVRFPGGTEEVLDWALARDDYLYEKSGSWQKLILDASLPENTRKYILNSLYLLPRLTWWIADGRFLNYESVDCPLVNPVPLELYIMPALGVFFPDQHALLTRNIIPHQLPSGEIPSFMGHMSMHDLKYRVFSPWDVSTYVISTAWQIFWGGGTATHAEEMYPVIKKALQWGKTLDMDDDGVPDCHGIDQAWDTWPMFGASCLVADMWMVALKIGEKLAQHFKDKDFAAWCAQIFKQADDTVESRLWNGEYYDLYDDPENDRHSDTCFIDQFDGQTVAYFLGLGDVHPREQIKKAVESIWKLNVEPCKFCARSGAKPDGSSDNTSMTNKQSNVFSPITISPLGAIAMRVGKVKEAIELMEEASTIVLEKMRDPWHGLLMFDADTGEHFYGKHYSDILIIWDILHALTGFSVNCLDNVMTLEPPLVPVKGPVLTKLFFGQVSFEDNSGKVLLVMTNTNSPACISQLKVKLPVGVKAKECISLGGKKASVKPDSDGYFVFTDISIAPDNELRIEWK